MDQLFTSWESQIVRMCEINERVWKDRTITEAEIRKLGEPPEYPDSDNEHLWCAVLLSDTGDPVETFVRNWKACELYAFPGETRGLEESICTPQRMRMYHRALPRPRGLRWTIAQLGRHDGWTEWKVVDWRKNIYLGSFTSIGPELPLIAAMHPMWARLVGDMCYPSLIAADLEIADQVGGQFKFVPKLHNFPILSAEGKIEKTVISIFLERIDIRLTGYGYFPPLKTRVQ